MCVTLDLQQWLLSIYLLLLCPICWLDTWIAECWSDQNKEVHIFYTIPHFDRNRNRIFDLNLKRKKRLLIRVLLDWINDVTNKSNFPVLFARCWPNLLCSHFLLNPAICVDYMLAHLPFFVCAIDAFALAVHQSRVFFNNSDSRSIIVVVFVETK